MNPLVIAALISGGSQLLGGLFGGIGAGQEREFSGAEAEKNRQAQREWLQMQIDAQKAQAEQQFGYQQQLAGGERDWEKQKFNVRAGMTRPQTPYYGIEQGLPATDLIMRNALMGNLQERWGGEGGAISRLGITPEMFSAGTQQFQPEPLPEIPDWFKYEPPRETEDEDIDKEETIPEKILRRAGGGGGGFEDYLRKRVSGNVLRRRR